MNKILKEVRLCQVDGFISALSLLRAKMMIRNGQRPYAHVDPKFYAPLPDDIGDVGGELRKMTKAKYDALLARIHGKLNLNEILGSANPRGPWFRENEVKKIVCSCLQHAEERNFFT